MRNHLALGVLFVLVGTASGQPLEPIVYRLKFPEPAKNYALVEAVVPTDRQAVVDMMMPIWTPGFYRVENYAAKVQDFSAQTTDGKPLKFEQPKKNRWRIETEAARKVLIRYRINCTNRFVTSNWVGSDMLVLNGAPSFITLAEKAQRPHDVYLELPPQWKQVATGLDAAPDGKPHHYRAADYDILVDSPIIAGNLSLNEFEVAGSKHVVAAGGETAQWDGKRAAADFAKIVEQNHRLWGVLPFRKYVFQFSVKEKGNMTAGLEHANSALMFGNSLVTRGPTSNLSWLMFVSHEYFHAFNVKRLRPIELGPFDYEKEPRTSGLWVAEGLTTYYGDLLVARAGLCGTKEYLARLSSHIESLQKSPGRLLQTLDQASLDVWSSSKSGVGGAANTVSYYVKGPVVGFVLDAKIQQASQGKRSLDDVMRLAYQRFGGIKGFSADQFRETAEEVAGADLKTDFRKWLATTDELVYADALEWFGLRFRDKSWQLEVRDLASPAQQQRLRAWLERPR